MKVVYPFLVVAFAGVMSAVSQPALAQRGRSDEARRRAAIENDRRWNDDDPWNDDYRWRNSRPGVRRGQDEEWLRRKRARREEWCRRHRYDGRCDDFYRRNDSRRYDSASWCWDRNRDGRCDYINDRRDTRGVYRRSDNGPEWDRWLRSFGLDLRSAEQYELRR